MTKDERTILSRIEDKVLECCLKITALVEKHDHVNERVSKVELDLYGNSEDRETNPGLISQVADLRRSRRLVRVVMNCMWGVTILVIGALVGMIMKGG
jgi:hypothetical protein